MKHTSHLAGYFFGGCFILGLIVSGLGQLHRFARVKYGQSAAAAVEFLIFLLPVLYVGAGLYFLWRHSKRDAYDEK